MKQILLAAAAVGALAFGGAVPATAGLLGDSVTVDYIFNTPGTIFQNLGTQTVAPTALFTFGKQSDFLVSDTRLDITNIAGADVPFIPAPFNGIQLIDNTHADITGVTIDAATNLAGLVAGDVAFDASDIFVNLQGLTTLPSILVRLDITTTATPVSEPASLVLLTVGLVGLGLQRRGKLPATSLAAPP